ncbi:MAG: DJ-1/PfpI family protein [Candidatus Omnitrophica bacterium]|nr:DJ-1/PfpI family protein [Candidatus Omnitrophota bacterium]
MVLAAIKGVLMVLLIIAQNGFRDEEYFKPKQILETAGYKVITASAQAGLARGKLGGTTQADISLKDVKVDEYEAIIFIGGPGAADYFIDKTALNLAKEAYQKDKVVGAICIAPGILARAGILKGKKATVYPSELDTLKNAGAVCVNRSVVIDGKIITANGPDAAESFGKEIVKLLGGAK